jgi:hypothetical protein
MFWFSIGFLFATQRIEKALRLKETAKPTTEKP